MRTIDKKQKHLDHLAYEVTMLHHCSPAIGKLDPGEDRNVYIECFALHARVLHEFLISKRYKDKNVVAQDFIDKFAPKGEDPVGPIIKKIEDQILHMGWGRTHDNALKFDAETEGATILEWIDFWFTAFWTQLPPEYVPARDGGNAL